MNPVDHPHGGGEGRCPIGKPQPRTPWGKPALGVKTRKKRKKVIFIFFDHVNNLIDSNKN